MDIKTNPNSEEEYKFQEANDTGSHFTNANTGEQTASAIMEKTKRQHIFLVLIVIFASLGIYKLVNKFLHGISTRSTAMKQQSPVAAAPSVSAATLANTAITNRFSHLEQTQHSLQTSLQSLDSEIIDIKSTLADLDARFAQISDETQNLQMKQEALLQKQKKAEKKRTEEKKVAPKPIYYVRAIIPGRVWLTMQDGSTLTLGLGDKLAGYGTVTAIDVNQGVVTLSSGAVIGYNPDDR